MLAEKKILLLFLVALLLPNVLYCQYTFSPRTKYIYYKQDFGGNNVKDDTVSRKPIKECLYKQNNGKESTCGTYSLRKRGLFNGNPKYISQWYRQIDHTHKNDPNRGYFLQLDGSLDIETFYSFTITDFDEGEHISFSLWVVNCYTARQKQYWEQTHWAVQSPDFDIIVLDDNEHEIQRVKIGPVPTEDKLTRENDYKKSATWHCVGFDFYAPDSKTLTFVFQNRGTGSPGNDFGIDDILVLGWKE